MVASKRPGYTLLELVVALTLGASLLLAGRAVFDRIGATGRDVARVAAELDAERVGYAELRALVRDVEVGADSGMRVVGGERRLAFRSWCASDEGTWTSCPVVVSVDTSVVVDFGVGFRTVSSGRGRRGTLRYLADARYGGRWQSSWGDAPGVPLAIGVIFGTDTTVLRTGPRG